jgi:hypothetical protein
MFQNLFPGLLARNGRQAEDIPRHDSMYVQMELCIPDLDKLLMSKAATITARIKMALQALEFMIRYCLTVRRPAYNDPRKNAQSTRVFCLASNCISQTGVTGNSRMHQSRRLFDIECPHRNGIISMQLLSLSGSHDLCIGPHRNSTVKKVPMP